MQAVCRSEGRAAGLWSDEFFKVDMCLFVDTFVGEQQNLFLSTLNETGIQYSDMGEEWTTVFQRWQQRPASSLPSLQTTQNQVSMTTVLEKFEIFCLNFGPKGSGHALEVTQFIIPQVSPCMPLCFLHSLPSILDEPPAAVPMSNG